MAVPKRKTTPSRGGMRRSHQRIRVAPYVEDKESGEMKRPYHMDMTTGMYKGRVILQPKQRHKEDK